MSERIARLNAAFDGRYRILRELGEGSAAVVFLARDQRHKRDVALKVLKPELSERLDHTMFLREIEIVAGLTHPNILPLHDSGSVEGDPFFMTPYIDGGSLRDRLDSRGALSPSDAIQLTAELADALQTAHENGVLHRDIKPENVLLIRGHALLADFGIAGSIDRGTPTDTLSPDAPWGTPRYMPPEQASAATELDATSDLYSLGCVFFEMLTGRPPFEARSTAALIAAHLATAPPSLADLGMESSVDLQGVLDTLLAKAPADRPPSATALLRLLRRATVGVRATVGTPAGRPNVGRIVTRLCNRWRQVNAFDAFLRESWSQHAWRPQVYVVHGEEGSAHSSLVDRLAHTRVSQFAARVHPGGRGHVARVKVPWPTGYDLETLTRDLTVSLFRELAPSYMDDDLAAERLLSLPAVADATVLMLEHTLHSVHWNATTVDVLRWYCRDFLGSVTSSAHKQQLLVFVKVTYPSTRTRNPLSFWSSQRIRKRIRQDLTGLFQATDAVCAGLVMDELAPITIEDIKDWFAKNHIYDSEETQNRLAERILGGSKARGLASVEAALEEVHATFVTELAATARGGPS